MLSLVIGVVLFAWPDITLQALAVIGGIGFVVRGIIRGLIAVTDHGPGPGSPSWSSRCSASPPASPSIAWPDVTVGVIGFLLGFSALLAGVGEIVAVLRAEEPKPDRGLRPDLPGGL